MSGIRRLKQREWKFLGRRISLRLIPVRVFSADLVIWEQARRNVDIYTALIPRRLRPFRAALWGHGGDYVGSHKSFDIWLRRLLTRKADWFFAYSEAGGDSAASQGVNQDRISVIYNSTDTQLLKQQINDLSTSEVSLFKNEKIGLGNNLVLFMAGLDAVKRISLVLEVCILVKKELPDLELIVCGDGTDRYLVEKAASEHSWIKYLGPTVGRSKALALTSSKLILNPGPVGLLAVDSLTAGRPIITCADANHGPEFEYLVEGETCLIVQDSPEILAATVQSLLTDAGLLEKLSKNCIAAAAPLSSENMAKNFFDGIIKSLAN